MVRLTKEELPDWIKALAWLRQFIEILNPLDFPETLKAIDKLLLFDADAIDSEVPRIIGLTRHLDHPSLDMLRDLWAGRAAIGGEK